VEKNSKADRARQFMPFAALRGFEELIRRQTEEPTPRRELSEYEADQLSRRLARVEKGDLVRVRYYQTERYVTLEGMVSDIDFAARHLRVIKTNVPFDDLLQIEKI